MKIPISSVILIFFDYILVYRTQLGISDNGRKFHSNEFIKFYKQYEIAFYTYPPFYTAATYGAAVNANKSFIECGIYKSLLIR